MNTFIVLVIVWFVLWTLVRIARYIRKERYFASEEFVRRKAEIGAFVSEHNDIAAHTAEIRDGGSFQVGASASGSQAHLADSRNTSQWNYRRDRNVANFGAPNVHNCSLQVVRNAHADPIKYVMKYFQIKPDEPTLRDVEQLGKSIVELEEAVGNLREREASITQSLNPPRFILKHYQDEFMSQVGAEVPPLAVPYPVYVFEYVSAGGNSSQRTTLTLQTPVIDVMIETLGQKIRWRKSAAGQRSLMTAKLRNLIKQRDNYTCRNCGISLAKEPHLLLEVDHILPVSRGGLSTPENLQTLCWRCNRSKSNKVGTGTMQHDAPTAPVGPQKGVRSSESSRSGSTEAQVAGAKADVQDQLAKLRELFEAGLFTDAEYQAKRADLIKRL